MTINDPRAVLPGQRVPSERAASCECHGIPKCPSRGPARTVTRLMEDTMKIVRQEDQGASAAPMPVGQEGSAASVPAAPSSQTEARPTPRTDRHGNALGTEYLLPFPGSRHEHIFVCSLSYDTLEREAADLREKCRAEWDARIVAEREREALGIVLNLCMEALPECQAWGDLPGHIAALQARLDEAEQLWLQGQARQEDAERALAEARANERERCARVCERRAEERFEEHGTTEPDTNASYYGGTRNDEYEALDEEDHDCAAAIRTLTDEAKP